MYDCERCGAALAPNIDHCAYCGEVSTQARAWLQANGAGTIAREAIARQMALAEVEHTASRALMWGLLSVLFICLPVPSVLAFTAHHRAKQRARDGGVELPARANVGRALAWFSALTFVGFFTWMCVDIHADNVRVEARRSELQKIIAAKGTNVVLDHDFACALTEAAILREGFGGSSRPGDFIDLQCAGVVRVLHERAEMPDFMLRTDSGRPLISAVACFKHGHSWFVERLSATSCNLADQ